MKVQLKCHCGATCWAKAIIGTQGDGVMTAEVIEEVGERVSDWEGGDPTCPHDDEDPKIVNQDYGDFTDDFSDERDDREEDRRAGI